MQNKLVQKRLKMHLLRVHSVFNPVTSPSSRHGIIGAIHEHWYCCSWLLDAFFLFLSLNWGNNYFSCFKMQKEFREQHHRNRMHYEQHYCKLFIKKKNLSKFVAFLSPNIIFFPVFPCELVCQPASFLTMKHRPDAILAVSWSAALLVVSSLHPAQNPSSIKKESGLRYLWNGMVWAEVSSPCKALRLCFASWHIQASAKRDATLAMGLKKWKLWMRSPLAQLLFGFLHLKDEAAASGSLQEKCNAIFQEKRLEASEQARSLLPSVVMACETTWWLYAGKHNIILKGLGQ